jgi:hypothetical protein
MMEKGLHNWSWNMSRILPQPEGRGRSGGAAQFRRRAQPVDAGLYKITLTVNGEEVDTHDLLIVDDPILYPDKP